MMRRRRNRTGGEEGRRKRRGKIDRSRSAVDKQDECRIDRRLW